MDNGLTGVYAIIHRPSGRVYVGSSARSIENRWITHKILLRGNRHHSIYLQRCWNNHPGEDFDFVVLEECVPEDCLVVEQKWIDRYSAHNAKHGFNMSPTAGSTYGFRFHETALKNLSDAHFGIAQSEDTRKKIYKNSAKAKLTFEQAEEIRHRYGPARGRYCRWTTVGMVSTRELAKEYGVSSHAISMIVMGKTHRTEMQ